jgi:hypothetical protein
VPSLDTVLRRLDGIDRRLDALSARVVRADR